MVVQCWGLSQRFLIKITKLLEGASDWAAIHYYGLAFKRTKHRFFSNGCKFNLID